MTHVNYIPSPDAELAHASQVQANAYVPTMLAQAQAEVAAQHYRNIEVDLDVGAGTYWCWMRPEGKPIVTTELLADLQLMQESLTSLFIPFTAMREKPFSYYVFGSRTPGIYSLGGDLDFFARSVRNNDQRSIDRYAHTCVDIVYRNTTAFDLPVVTIALVQGDALGGGFETALSHDVIVAERNAKMGLPEVLFNLFPGMGAYSFLSRRLDASRAQQMILSGRIYRAEELHEMGLVDVLAEDGEGEKAVRDYIRKMSRTHTAQRSLYQVRRRVSPVTWDELHDVVDIWVDAVFELQESDMRKMARLTNRQSVRVNRDAALAVAAE